jgi:branched-chain amino acid transport system substrate-binding protein
VTKLKLGSKPGPLFRLPFLGKTHLRRRSVYTIALCLLLGATSANASAQGLTASSIAIGVSSPQTGSESSVGIDYLAGAQLAFEDANKNGGVFGRSIKLTVIDDAGKADTTAANAKKLIADGSFALFGFYGGNNTLAALPAINEARIPLVGVFTGNQSLRDPPNRYIFHARTEYYAEIAHVAKRLTAMAADRVAVVHFDDRGGKDSGERTAAEFRKLNVKVPAVIAIERGSTKVDAAAAALAKADVQWVVMILTNKTSAALIQKTRELGGLYQFMSLSFTNAAALIKDLGGKSTGLAFAQVVPFPMSDASSKLVAEFRTLAGTRVPINYVSMEGFVTAKVMIEGLRRAGKDPTREKFIAGLESGRAIDLDNYSVRFTPQDRTGGQFVELTVVDRSGRLIR